MGQGICGGISIGTRLSREIATQVNERLSVAGVTVTADALSGVL